MTLTGYLFNFRGIPYNIGCVDQINSYINNVMIGTSNWFICIGAILAAAIFLSVIYSIYYHNRETNDHIQIGYDASHSELKILN